ncbi:MAG TPA: DUF503 domain-containing protein [Acidimicrobiales bacterium]|nr:DUF503 domain-containing protein [Acidimicrobiales bacterium]
MHVASLTVELHIPRAHSLKEKRAVVTPILEGCRRRFAVAAAEVAHQDLWQRATLGVATVSSSATRVEQTLDAVERFVWSFPEVEVTAAHRDWLEAGAP